MTDFVFSGLNRNTHHINDIHWRQHKQIFGEIPLNIKHCLLDEGSLTKRLIDISNNNFSVQVHSQIWNKAYADEYRALHINPPSRTNP